MLSHDHAMAWESLIRCRVSEANGKMGRGGGGHATPAQWLIRDQCSANTCADSQYPSMTFTATPAVNASNGLNPARVSSRNRVVRPMLKKQKMNAQVRRSFSGATSAGTTCWLYSGSVDRVVTAVTSNEAVRNPMTNFGNRHQICAALGVIPACLSQRVVATSARTKAQIPIHTSRPTTFMSVKANVAWSGVPEIAGTVVAIRP